MFVSVALDHDLQVLHTGLEALPSKKKVSVDGTGVPGFLRPVW